MKFISDKILVTVATVASEPSGMYVYRVTRVENGTLIFVGNFYHTYGESNYTFDITDIIRSDVTPLNFVDFENTAIEWENKHINSYNVEVRMSGITATGKSGYVCKSYLYPNTNAITAPDMFFDNTVDTQKVSILQQGRYKSNLTGNLNDVIPIVPCYKNGYEWANSNFPFWVMTECGSSIDEITMYGQVNDLVSTSTLFSDDYYPGGKINFNYATVLKNVCREVQSNNITSCEFYASATEFVEPDEGELVAKGELCLNKRYFLVWQDRLGSMMSKPFNDVSEYSESFEKEEVHNYSGIRKLSNVIVQPKWKISSGWIKEILYPLYESIYISPVLFLYDMKYNTCHNVIVSGDYIEKTYRNQKKMINIELELEESKRQNIIY